MSMTSYEVKRIRSLCGLARRMALREHLSDIDFTADVHTIRTSERLALVEVAKMIQWRKSVSSSMSLGAAFFVYLSRDVVRPPGRTVVKGKRWTNDGIAS